MIHPQLGLKGALHLGHAVHGIQGARESDDKRVALRVYFRSIPFLDRVPHDFMMLFEHSRILISQIIEEIRRAFDISKEEGDSAGGLYTRWYFRSLEQAFI